MDVIYGSVMIKPDRQVRDYVQETLGTTISLRSWPDRDRLPVFLVRAYHFYLTELHGIPCLLMLLHENVQHTPPSVVRHNWQQVVQVADCPIIYVSQVISPYERQKLIEYRIPFIVPGNQMYLPDLGIDLREYYRKPLPTVERVSPATQALLIYVLNCGSFETRYTASDFITQLGYARMTIIRALDELQAIELGYQGKVKRERYWQWDGTRKELWKACQSRLRNPCTTEELLWMSEPVCLRAGYTALSDYSMLTAPRVPIHAIGVQEWRELRKNGIKTFPELQPGGIGLQIWHYDPRTLTSSNSVDPISLYLSLLYPSLMDSAISDTDERVEAALDELMKGVGL